MKQAETGETDYAKQLILALEADDRAHNALPSVQPALQGSMKTKLSQVMATLNGYVRGQHQNAAGERHAARKSRKDESRLEFQRFIYW